MPIPRFLIEFHSRHGRDPRPDELTPEQKRLCLKCSEQSLSDQERLYLEEIAGYFN